MTEIKIIVTEEFIEAGATSGCGFTNRQIGILDGGRVPQKGWRRRALGKVLTREAARAFLFEARRSRQRPRPGSPQEVHCLTLLADHSEPAEKKPGQVAQLSGDDCACPLCQGWRWIESELCPLCCVPAEALDTPPWQELSQAIQVSSEDEQ